MTKTLTTGSDTTTYIYTADDTLFARIDPAGALNVRIGEHWETDGTTTRTNYRYASSLIAVRTQTATTNTLTHVIDDTQTTTSVVHTLGGATGRVWYDPWGLTRATTGTSSPTPHGYTSQHSEPSGLIDYHARQYDPTHGRFTSPDTIIADPTNPQDLNRYAYVRNNPATMTDPSGHVTDFCGSGDSVGGCGDYVVSPYDNSVVTYSDGFTLSFSVGGSPYRTLSQVGDVQRLLIARAFMWDGVGASEVASRGCLRCLERELDYLRNTPLSTNVGSTTPTSVCGSVSSTCLPTTWERVVSVLKVLNPLDPIESQFTAGVMLAEAGATGTAAVFSLTAMTGGPLGVGGVMLVSMGTGIMIVGVVVAGAALIDAWANP